MWVCGCMSLVYMCVFVCVFVKTYNGLFSFAVKLECMSVRVCVCVREREREREKKVYM